MKQYLRIGCIVRAHGVHGAVKLQPTTDRIERFRGLSHAYLEERNGAIRPVEVSGVRLLNDAVALEIAGVDTVEAAERLRGEPEKTVLEIALDCGFPTVTYFNRLFLRQYGKTPTAYRQESIY